MNYSAPTPRCTSNLMSRRGQHEGRHTQPAASPHTLERQRPCRLRPIRRTGELDTGGICPPATQRRLAPGEASF